MLSTRKLCFSIISILALASCGGGGGGESDNLSSGLTFFGYPPAGSSAERGMGIFGLDPATNDRRHDCAPGSGCSALFEGLADDGHTDIVSNGRTCFDCHRIQSNFQLGAFLPLDKHLPADDPLIKFVDADAQFNPDGPRNLNDFGLILIRPGRFKGLAHDDPFRKFNVWRKVPTNFNLAFAHGFVGDLRNKDLASTDQSATMTHTQLGDTPFTKLSTKQKLDDLQAFQFTLFSDPRLEALLYPGDKRFNPSYDDLVNDPFRTVPVSTPEQLRGQKVFERFCFTCHNVPNVFNNRAQADPQTSDSPGQGFDIGIGEANFNQLDFRYFNPETGEKELITLPLTKQNGEVVPVPVTTDIGRAAITKHWEDLYVFKVPQLRNLTRVAPFMHDNSLRTLEDVVNYFNSDQFNNSAGGRAFPVHMTPEEQADLLEFLKIL